MKKAISLSTWVDLKDGHEYHEGDEYPFDGREVDEKRLKELSTTDNLLNEAVIEIVEVEEKPKKN